MVGLDSGCGLASDIGGRERPEGKTHKNGKASKQRNPNLHRTRIGPTWQLHNLVGQAARLAASGHPHGHASAARSPHARNVTGSPSRSPLCPASLALAELRRAGEKLAQQLVQKAAEESEAAEASEADKAAKSEAEERAAYEAESDRLQKEEHRRRIPWSAAKAARERQPWRYPKPRDKGPRFFRFEVVDVRLTPAPEESERGSWLAYGTLAQLSEPQN